MLSRFLATKLPAAVGCVLAIALLAGLAEAFLRRFPLSEQEPFLGAASPRRGILAADDAFGVRYRSFDDFAADNAERLRPFLPLAAPGPPLWAFFGTSFVQAPGMLGDTLRARLPSRRMFYLGRNEDLLVRFAQIALLLEEGLRPERLFVVFVPGDLASLGAQPLATVEVTEHGALGYRPRLPAGAGGHLVTGSALARTVWFRIGGHVGNPGFDPHELYEHLDDVLLDDARRPFANLARVAQAHAVPVTVVLIPGYHQVMRGASYEFQDRLAAALTELGFDMCDPRAAFARAASPDLYIPDRHFSPAGNKVLADALLSHLAARGVVVPDQQGASAR